MENTVKDHPKRENRKAGWLSGKKKKSRLGRNSSHYTDLVFLEKLEFCMYQRDQHEGVFGSFEIVEEVKIALGAAVVCWERTDWSNARRLEGGTGVHSELVQS